MKHYAFENAAVRLAGLDATRELLEPIFFNRRSEILLVAMCDDDLRMVGLLTIPGVETCVTIPLPRILRFTVLSGCTGIIIAHNHPSGDLQPSQQDLIFTRRLVAATESVDIQVLDHLIFNDGSPFSFRRRGLL